MSDVTIAGVGLHPFGRFEDRSITDMGAHAVRAALREAGVTDRRGIQATFCGTAYGGVAAAHKVLGRLSMTGGPIVDVEAGLRQRRRRAHARRGRDPRRSVRHGVGVRHREDAEGHHPFVVLRAVARASRTRGHARPTSRCARNDLMRESELDQGRSRDRRRQEPRHGVHNPNAMFRKAVTAEEVLGSRVVCEPLHLWMLCSPNEGAAAVVLRGEGEAGSVRVRSTILRSHLPGNVLDESTPLSGLIDDDVPSASTLAADAAYEEAGIGVDGPRPGRVPGHRRGPRAAGLRGAPAVRPRRRRQAAGRRRDRARRPTPGQRQRRFAVEGRAARCVRPRTSDRAHAPVARPGRLATSRERQGRAGPHGRSRRQRLGDDPVDVTGGALADGRCRRQAAAVVDDPADTFDVRRRAELQIERQAAEALPSAR